MRRKIERQFILLVILCLFISQIVTQNNICSSNCREGYCTDQNPKNCTSCDSGQVNVNGRCLSSSTQPNPLRFLSQNDNGLDGVSNVSSLFTCTVFRASASNSENNFGSLFYQIVPGATYTRQFYINQKHQYIQVKFNSAIIQPSTVIVEYELLASDGSILFNERKQSQPPNDPALSIACGQQNTTVYGVFYVKKSLSSKQQNLTLQVKSLDPNAVFGVSNFEIFYGACNKKCQTCSGPTQSDCLSCRGLYMTLQKGTCQTCPTGYYDRGTVCQLCPQHCSTCKFNTQSQNITCQSCHEWAQLNSAGLCQTNFSSYSLPYQLLYKSSDNWKSSQISTQPLTICGQYSIIGGVSIGRQGSTIYKTFQNLPVHSQINIKMVVWMIDQQLDNTNLYQILVDGKIVKQEEVNISPPESGWVLSNQCGNTNPEIQFVINLNSIPHQGRNVTISLKGLKNYFGLRDFTMVVNNKTSVVGCSQQQNGTCLSCENGFSFNPITNKCNQCKQGHYLDKSKQHCQVCPIECKTCQLQLGVGKIYCLSCVEPLTLSNGFCQDTNGAIYKRDIVPEKLSPLLYTPHNSPFPPTQWILYPKLPNYGLTNCSNHTILGSNQIVYKSLSLKREYSNLHQHRGIKIYLQFYQIDSYTTDSVSFILNGNKSAYKPQIQKKQYCGDPNIPDAIVKLEFFDENHIGDNLTFEILVEGKTKVGINNVILFLLNCEGCDNVVEFQVQAIPIYSLNTPPQKGVEVKVIFDQKITNLTPITNTIDFSITKTSQHSQRLLQGLIQFNQNLPIATQKFIANRQFRVFLQLYEDYIDSQISVNPTGYLQLENEMQNKLLSSKQVTSKMPRYIDIDQNSVENRTNIRNLKNLFQGCAILALWIGLISFIFGFSCAFDDFFILVQLIFLHIFIQLPFSPPSFRLPLEGMQIVQFMSWLPWQARVQIQKGIIASSLYQQSPIVYEQYYQDIVFARTIYHTVLFFVFMIVLYILLQVFTHVIKSSRRHKFADSYTIKYYSDYENHKFSFIDKFVRFAYLTIVWACTLQFTNFKNSPQEFNIWNSVLCIVIFALAVLYPVGGMLWLRKKSSEMSDSTFRKNYEDVRIDPGRLFHFVWRYYKILVIALLIGLLYDTNPLATLIPLIIIHIVDTLITIFLKPIAIYQQPQLNVCLYNYYPAIYLYTTILQSLLFALLELFILIIYAVRDSASTYSYLGLGYFCCVIVIALLLNGLLRLVWGFIKIVEGCFAKSKQMKLIIENKALKEKQTNEQLVPMKSLKQLQSNLNTLQSKSRLNTIRKTTMVSKIS